MEEAVRALAVIIALVAVVGCSPRTPKVISTSTTKEPGGTTLATVMVECNGASPEACEGEGLTGIVNACPWEAPRHSVKVTKTEERVEVVWRCEAPRL